MRIDAYIQVNQLYHTSKTKSKANTANSDSRDSLEISSYANAYQVAKKAAGEAVFQGTDVRMDRINDIKARMEAGSYHVSVEDVADKMTDLLTR